MGKIKIRGQKPPKWLTGILSFIIILSLIAGITQILILNVQQIEQKMPQYSSQIQISISQIKELTGIENIGKVIEENFQDLDIRPLISSVLGSLTTFIGSLIVTIVYVIFLLIEEAIFPKKIKAFFSNEKNYEDFKSISDQITGTVNNYLAVKTLTSLLVGTLSFFILILIGVDFPFLWAFLIFLLNYIPYIGSFIATFLPALFAIFQFGTVLYFIWVFLAVEAAQVFVAYYVEPRLMGRTLNLSPLIVFLTLIFGGYLWGALGMILSVPTLSILMIILAHFPSTERIAMLLSEKGHIKDIVNDESKLSQ